MNPLRRARSSGGSAGLGATPGSGDAASDGGVFFPTAGVPLTGNFNPSIPAAGAPAPIGSFTHLLQTGLHTDAGFMPPTGPSFTANMSVPEVPIGPTTASRGARNKRPPVALSSAGTDDDAEMADASYRQDEGYQQGINTVNFRKCSPLNTTTTG